MKKYYKAEKKKRQRFSVEIPSLLFFSQNEKKKRIAGTDKYIHCKQVIQNARTEIMKKSFENALKL